MPHHRCIALAVIISIVAGVSFAGGPAVARRTQLIRIDNVKADALLRSNILAFDEYEYKSILSVVRDTALAIVTPAERALLSERGFPSTVIMEDTSELALLRRGMYGPAMRLTNPYHTYPEIVQRLRELEKAHPSLIHVFTIGTTSQKQQPIFAAVIGNIPGMSRGDWSKDDRPAVMLDGCHHSNEVNGAEIVLAAAEMLVEGYGNDAEVTRWLDNLRIVVVPVVNVDGHDVVSSGRDPRWRKNTRDTDSNGLLNYPDGVDINRNYDFNWAGGGAGDGGSGRYRGPFPFSESEPRAIAELARRERFVLSITYHSQGEVVYYPWNWSGRPAPDDVLLQPMARALAGSIRRMSGDSSYRAEAGAALVGQSYPWLYGTLGTFDFIVETGFGAAIFPPHEVPGIIEGNLIGIRTMLRRAEGPGVAFHVADAATGASLDATVWVPKIETEELRRRGTNPSTGTLYRFMPPAAQQVIVSRPGYETQILNAIAPPESGWRRIEVRLIRSAR
jgi:hypothetical protein